MKQRTRHLLLAIAVLPLASLPASAKNRRAAPDFTLRSVSGSQVRLRALRGHTVVLDFWASWCPPCIAQVPAMQRLTEQYKKRGVLVLDINILEEPQVVEQFLSTHGSFGSEILLTSDQSVLNAYHVEEFPTTIVIDQAGNIQATVSGGNPNDLATIQQALHRLTAAHRP